MFERNVKLLSSVQKRQDYPDVSEALPGQVTQLVNVMRTCDVSTKPEVNYLLRSVLNC